MGSSWELRRRRRLAIISFLSSATAPCVALYTLPATVRLWQGHETRGNRFTEGQGGLAPGADTNKRAPTTSGQGDILRWEQRYAGKGHDKDKQRRYEDCHEARSSPDRSPSGPRLVGVALRIPNTGAPTAVVGAQAIVACNSPLIIEGLRARYQNVAVLYQLWGAREYGHQQGQRRAGGYRLTRKFNEYEGQHRQNTSAPGKEKP